MPASVRGTGRPGLVGVMLTIAISCSPASAAVVPGDTFDVAVTAWSSGGGAYIANPASVSFGSMTNIGTTVGGYGGEDIFVSSSSTLIGPGRNQIVLDFATEFGGPFVPAGLTVYGEPITKMQYEFGYLNAGTNPINFTQPVVILSEQATVEVVGGGPPVSAAVYTDVTNLPGALASVAVRASAADVTGQDNHAVLTFVTQDVTSVSRISSIGFLASGASTAVAAISDDGNFAAGSGSTVNGTRGLRWTPGSLRELPTGTTESNRFSRGKGISDDGLTVVGSAGYSGYSYAYKYVDTTGSGSFDQVFLGSLGGYNSQANGVSADGSVIVGYSNSQAFRWTEATGMQGLGDLPGGYFSSEAYAVSADGTAIVGRGNSASGNEAFRHIGGVMSGLGDLFGADFNSRALGVSPSGAVVVGYATGREMPSYPGSSYFSSIREAAVWRGGMLQGLGLLGGGDYASENFSEALGVSASGRYIVGRTTVPGGSSSDTVAFIWDAVHGMRDLKAVMQADYGLNLTGWELRSATCISADGSVIGGVGINPSGLSEGFIIYIDDLVELPTNYFVQLITGSPVTLSQTVSTPADPFSLALDYDFQTTTGELAVILDGVSLGTILAPDPLQGGFQTAQFLVDGALLNLTDVDLEFVLDGPTGSSVLLDNISFLGLANGDFQSGDLTGWDIVVTGDGTILVVPEPSTLTLAAFGLFGLLGGARRRRPAA